MAHPMSNSRGGYHIHVYHITIDKTKKTFKGNTSNQSLDLKKYKYISLCSWLKLKKAFVIVW